MKKLLTFAILGLLTISGLAQTPYALGWHSDPDHAKHMKAQFVHSPDYKTANLPDVVDLSGVMPNGPKVVILHFPPVYDQLQIGSCTANAGTAVMEFQFHKQYHTFMGGSAVGGSRLGLYTCSLMHDGSWPQDAGSTTSTVVWVLENQGIGLESIFPYRTAFGTPLPAAYLPNALHQMALKSYDVASDDHISIKTAIANNQPVIYGGYVYNAIMSLDSTNYFNPPHTGQPVGGHERVIAGYNSTLTHVFNGKTYTGFYWVRNSWSANWGYKGYCWEPMVEVENTQINEDFAVISLVIKK